jgi:hypothetical protein
VLVLVGSMCAIERVSELGVALRGVAVPHD